MKKYSKIQKKLGDMRKNSGDSIQKVAYEAQVTENTVRNFENGSNKSLDLTLYYMMNYVEDNDLIATIESMYRGDDQ